MLTKCPECELQVSDKAITCPHCGYPLTTTNHNSRIQRKSNKRMRLPNGFGQISELKGKNLRKPFRAMVTVGKNEFGKPISKLLKPEAFFETYNQAYAALVEYNKNPYDLEDSITVKELYERWSEEYFATLKNASAARTVKSAWLYCTPLYNMRAKDLRAYHIKGVMENGTRFDEKKNITIPITSSTKERVKSMFNLMLDYANERDIVEKNYARTFNLSKDVIQDIEDEKVPHIPFTSEEIKILWENISYPYVRLILIQCYSGLRPQEIGLIKLNNVDFDNWTMTGGMKTPAGTGRVMPIHPAIRELVEKEKELAISLNSEYIFTCFDPKKDKTNYFMTYDKYSYRFENIMKVLGLNKEHRPHDPRMHFITFCKKCKVDEYALKYVVGHKIEDITEAIYTQRDPVFYMEEISKLEM